MSTITQPMCSATQLSPHLLRVAPTSSFYTPANECAKTITKALVQHRRSLEGKGLPRIIITDTMGWDAAYVDDTRYAMWRDILLTPLLPSAVRVLRANSCLMSASKNKSVTWVDEVATSCSSTTTSVGKNQNGHAGLYNRPHLLTTYATYPHPDEHHSSARRHVKEKCYRMKFEDKLEKQRQKSCQGRSGAVEVVLLRRLREEEYRRGLELKRDYEMYINERMYKKMGCSVRVMEAIEEDDEE